MKKIISLLLTLALLLSSAVLFSGCSGDTLIVQTNAYFAPFEYFEGDDIVGVDVEVMQKVADKLGKKLEFVNVEFAAIIDNVSAGKICDAGAAGITVTDARKEKVDFSDTYFTTVQYVIFPQGKLAAAGKTPEGDDYVVWQALEGMKIGVQTDTTGDFFVSDELEASLAGTGADIARFDSAQLACDAIAANNTDVAVVDQLPAKYIVSKNPSLACAALYYAGENGEADAPASEDYAICVAKGSTELLDAINAVLSELGEDGINKLVMKYMGFGE